MLPLLENRLGLNKDRLGAFREPRPDVAPPSRAGVSYRIKVDQGQYDENEALFSNSGTM